MIQVKLNLPTFLDLCDRTVCLKPGANEVDPKAWGKVKDHPITKHYIEAGAIVAEATKETAAQRKARQAAEAEAAAKAGAGGGGE